MKQKTKQVLLIGSLGSHNIGDELLLYAALEKNKNAIIMTADGKFTNKFCEHKIKTIRPFPVGIRSFFRYITNKKFREIFSKSLKDIEEIYYIGGGLFSISFVAITHWWIHFSWIKILFKNKINIHMEYQGIDKKMNFFAKIMTRKCFNKAKTISVRDRSSQEALEKIGITKNITLKKDRLQEWLEKNFAKKSNATKKESQVLINICRRINQKLWQETEQKICSKNNITPEKIQFIVMDPKDKKYIPKKFRGKIISPQTYTQTIKIFTESTVVIGERFHFLLLGNYLSQSTFLLRSPYAEKVFHLAQKESISVF